MSFREMFSESFQTGRRTVLVSTEFSNQQADQILQAFLELRRIAGHEVENATAVLDTAIANMSIGPYPDRVDGDDGLEPESLTDDDLKAWHYGKTMAISGLRHFVGPGRMSNRATASGNVEVFIDSFDGDPLNLGKAKSGSVKRHSLSINGKVFPPFDPHPKISLNRLQIDNYPIIRWANVIAHEFMHLLYKLEFEGGHDRGDFVYEVGDAIEFIGTGLRGNVWDCSYE